MSSLFFGNGTNVVHWRPNPDTRGTFDILSTCIITLLLCVWTAVHLSVPPPGKFWESQSKKVRWLVLALLAPEFVAYTAWYPAYYGWLIWPELTISRYQRQEALKIMCMVNNAYDRPSPTPWYKKLPHNMKRGIARLQNVLGLHTHKVVRVSAGT